MPATQLNLHKGWAFVKGCKHPAAQASIANFGQAVDLVRSRLPCRPSPGAFDRKDGGCRCGADVDGPTGAQAIRTLAAILGLVSSGPLVRTGGGGWHYCEGEDARGCVLGLV